MSALRLLTAATIGLVFLVGFLSNFSIQTDVAQAAPRTTKKILVYRGAGGCNSCADAAAKAARGFGYEVKFVSPSAVTAGVFTNVAAWVQPAGNAIAAAEALGHDKLSLIREFVRGGGGYVGFCAGAFLADSTVDDEGDVEGLGLIPFATADYTGTDDETRTMLWVDWGNQRRHLYFYGGPEFLVPINAPPATYVARYNQDGKVAAVQVNFGLGHVLLSGPHPEAPTSWKDQADKDDEDGSDLDLAKEMIRRALIR